MEKLFISVSNVCSLILREGGRESKKEKKRERERER